MKYQKLCAVLALMICGIGSISLMGCKNNSQKENKSTVSKNTDTVSFSEKLTAKTWKRDDNGSALKLNKDGSAVLTMQSAGKAAAIDGSWDIEYDALKITVNQNVINGKLVDKENTDIFTAFYTELNDSSIKENNFTASYSKWYVSDNYLVLGAVVWRAEK